MHTSHFVGHADLQTAYYDIGRGTPFLLVHGFTGSKLDFVNQMGWFVESHRVLAYDHRGHGETTNALPYTLEQLTDDLVSLLDTLEIPTCHVLGHSMGGMVVLRAALDHPERFRSLILMDTAPYPLQLMDDAVRARLNAIVREHGCQGLVAGMRGQPQPAPIRRGIDYLGVNEHWRRIQVKLEQMDPDAFVAFGAQLHTAPSQLDRLHEIDVPVTVIVGEHDAPLRQPAADLHAAIADSVLEVIPHAAHSPQYESADLWRDAVLAHLARAGR